jgi:hypothetical protein
MVFEGERLMFYTQPVHEGPATVSPPMALRTISGGRLRLAFSDYAKGWRHTALIAPGDHPPIARMPFTQFFWDLHGGTWTLEEGVYRGRGETGWQTADLGLGAENVEFSASVTLHEGVAAGFVFRPDQYVSHAGSGSHGDLIFYLDAERRQVVSARLPSFDQQRVRSFPVERGRPYHLRLCIRQPHFELYVDDILVLQGALRPQQTPAPSVGLFVDRGTATIADLALYELG